MYLVKKKKKILSATVMMQKMVNAFVFLLFVALLFREIRRMVCLRLLDQSRLRVVPFDHHDLEAMDIASTTELVFDACYGDNTCCVAVDSETPYTDICAEVAEAFELNASEGYKVRRLFLPTIAQS